MSEHSRVQVIATELDDFSLLVEAVEVSSQHRDVASAGTDFPAVANQVEAIASSIYNAVKRVAPTKATVEFGIDIAGEPGWLTAMLVKGKGSASLAITLEWEKAADSEDP